jgi:GTPase SAR1 family protein
MIRVYYKEAVGAIIVFDITREKTFQAVTKWKADIDDNLSVDGLSIPVVLLANKCDLAEEPLDKEMMEKFCKENNFIAWFETSAKDNINIDEAGNCLVEHILTHDPDAHKTVGTDKTEGTIELTKGGAASPEGEKSRCLCLT